MQIDFNMSASGYRTSMAAFDQYTAFDICWYRWSIFRHFLD